MFNFPMPSAETSDEDAQKMMAQLEKMGISKDDLERAQSPAEVMQLVMSAKKKQVKS